MIDQSLSTTITVDQTPQQVFDAVNNVRGWWSGRIEGRTDQLGAEWTYTVPDIHHTKQRIIELVPGRTVAWLVVDSHLTFTEDKAEWTGTTIRFDIAEKDGRTELRFTHDGLVPSFECFELCRTAWGSYITESLYELITTGEGRPSSFEGEVARPAIEKLQATQAARTAG